MNNVIDKETHIVFWGAILAFTIYQVFNFWYLPHGFVFPDEDRFYYSALKFLETGEFWSFNYRQWDMPGIAIIYSNIAYFFSEESEFILATRVFQSLLLISNAIMLKKISYIIFKNKFSSIFVYLSVLFYPFFVFYQGLILSENLFIFFMILGFFMLYKWSDTGFELNRYFYTSILFLTVSVYMKATLTFLPPLMATTFYLVNRFSIKHTSKVMLISAGVYILLMSPWWIRSYVLFDKVVPFTTTSTMNMYLGNNPKNISGGCDWAQDAEIKLYSTYEVSEMEYMNIYTQATRKFIKENPDRFFSLIWLKFKRFWNVVPNHENYSQGHYKYLSIFSYGIILLLSMVSFFIYRREYKTLIPIYILILYFTFIYSITIASIRYRLPIEPFLIVLASGTIAVVYNKQKGKV